MTDSRRRWEFTHKSNERFSRDTDVSIDAISRGIASQQSVSATSRDFASRIDVSNYSGDQRNYEPLPVPERLPTCMERSYFPRGSLSVSASLESSECSLSSRRHQLQLGNPPPRHASLPYLTERSPTSPGYFLPSGHHSSSEQTFSSRLNAPVPSVKPFPSSSDFLSGPRPISQAHDSTAPTPLRYSERSPITSNAPLLHDGSPISSRVLPPSEFPSELLPHSSSVDPQHNALDKLTLSSQVPSAVKQSTMSLRTMSPPPIRPVMLQSSLSPNRFRMSSRPPSYLNIPPPSLNRPPPSLNRPSPSLNLPPPCLYRSPMERPPDCFPAPRQSVPLEGSLISHELFFCKDLASPSCFTKVDPIERFRKQTEERGCAKKWINSLVLKCSSASKNFTEPKPKKQKVPLLIPLIRKDIKSCFEYLTLLEKKRKVLQEECDVQMWKWEVADVQVAMKTITDLMSKLRSADLCKRIKLKLLKIRKKKHQRIRRKERIRAVENERTEKTRKISAKIEEKRQLEEQALKEKREIENENKTLRDSLDKVKKKQEDIRQYLRVISALSKLRRARLQKRKVELGMQISTDKEVTENLMELLQHQLEKYNAEEEAIGARLKKDDKPSSRFNVLLGEIKGYLFGEPLDASHPLYPLYLENTKADNDADVLIDVRSQWDKYVVSDDHPSGTRIPVDWVYPSGTIG